MFYYLLICYAIASLYLALDVVMRASDEERTTVVMVSVVATLILWPIIAVVDMIAITVTRNR